MTKADLESYRETLLNLRLRLTGDVSHLTDEALRSTGGEASGSLSNAPLHMADLGTDNFEQEFTLSLLQNQEQALEEIADALRAAFGRDVSVRPSGHGCRVEIAFDSVEEALALADRLGVRAAA